MRTKANTEVNGLLEAINSEIQKSQRKYETPEDFYEVITHDISYLKNLEGLFICQRQFLHERKNRRDIATFRVAVEVHETSAKLAIQKQLVADKYNHYNSIFLPSFEKNLAIAEKRWETTISSCGKLINDSVANGNASDGTTKLKILIDEAFNEIAKQDSDKMKLVVRAYYLPKINRLHKIIENQTHDKK